MGDHSVTDHAIWDAIARNLPRTWEFYNDSGAWFGRDVATSTDDAARVAGLWLADDARWRHLDPYTTTLTVRCLATDERAQTTIIITP